MTGGDGPVEVAQRLSSPPRASYLRDFVYGAVDGAVTTFAIVAGAAGANLSSRVVVILGVANQLADGLSMAVSNYLGTRAERQQRDRDRADEHRQIEEVPDEEREEVRQLFAAKGFEGADLDRAVAVITSDRDLWVKTMMTEELGYAPEHSNPLRAALATFVAFVLVGTLPLLAYLVNAAAGNPIANPFAWSLGLTAVAFFGIGAVKAVWLRRAWWRSGIETLAIGGSAAGVAYLIGVLLEGVG